MGFFSKLTADTKESVQSIHSSGQVKAVYLIQPNGQAPIVECCYQGDGMIGDVDWFVWLAKMNADSLGLDVDALSEDQLSAIGSELDSGTAYRDTETGDIWSIYHDARSIIGGNFFKGTYSDIIPELEASANQLIASGRLEEVAITALVDVPYSIKLSFNPDAIYEELPASEDCPNQGIL